MPTPPTQVPIAVARSQGSSAPAGPPAASHPPTGATAMASARNNCVYAVNRLASEYQNTIPSASGDSRKHTRPSAYAAPTNATEAPDTNTIASRRGKGPRGNSPLARRGGPAAYSAAPSAVASPARARAPPTPIVTPQTTRTP